MKPMLARTLGPKFSQWPTYVQPKLNGVRALYQGSPIQTDLNSRFGVFQSRDEKIWGRKVLAHLHDELENITESLGSLILDGELYFHTWRLQRINAAIAVNRHEPTPDTPHVEFHVFDVVNPKLPFSERYLPVANMLREANLPHIRAVDTAMVHDREQLERYFELCVRDGYEGAMVRPDGFYEFGEHMGRNGTLTQYRSRTLWKHKSWEDDEFRCDGVTQGEGKADIGIGALLLRTKNGNFQFKVGTGFTDEERVEYMKNNPAGKYVKVRYLCLTADGIPFNPSFLAVLS